MGLKSRTTAGSSNHMAAELRAYGLSFPETHEDFPWGERVLKVRRKVFVFMGTDKGPDEDFGFSVKLPHSGQALLSLPFATPTGYGLGKSGWVSIRCTQDDPIPLELMKQWLVESYCAVAPRKLAAQLPQPA